MLNILPQDGVANYYDSIFSRSKSDQFFDNLINEINWQQDQLIMFGKLITTKRKVAWYGDKPFSYTYSKTTKQAMPWTDNLLELKKIIEEKCGEKFNSCLLNLYHDGSEGMSWHSDDEKEIVNESAIASLSFGATRKFSFKHKKTKQTISIFLNNASLLIMKGETQKFWQHSLMKSKKVTSPRINLTFRKMIESNYE